MLPAKSMNEENSMEYVMKLSRGTPALFGGASGIETAVIFLTSLVDCGKALQMVLRVSIHRVDLERLGLAIADRLDVREYFHTSEVKSRCLIYSTCLG